MQKPTQIFIGFIFISLIAVWLYLFFYSKDSKIITPEKQIEMIHSINNTGSSEMHTGMSMDAGSGVTVTVGTNGPTMRAMTPEEEEYFQKQMLGNE